MALRDSVNKLFTFNYITEIHLPVLVHPRFFEAMQKWKKKR